MYSNLWFGIHSITKWYPGVTWLMLPFFVIFSSIYNTPLFWNNIDREQTNCNNLLTWQHYIWYETSKTKVSKNLRFFSVIKICFIYFCVGYSVEALYCVSVYSIEKSQTLRQLRVVTTKVTRIQCSDKLEVHESNCIIRIMPDGLAQVGERHLQW